MVDREQAQPDTVTLIITQSITIQRSHMRHYDTSSTYNVLITDILTLLAVSFRFLKHAY